LRCATFLSAGIWSRRPYQAITMRAAYMATHLCRSGGGGESWLPKQEPQFAARTLLVLTLFPAIALMTRDLRSLCAGNLLDSQISVYVGVLAWMTEYKRITTWSGSRDSI